MDMSMHHEAQSNFIMLYAGILAIVLAICGYWYASKTNKSNTSRLKKEQKAVLKKKSKSILIVSHGLLSVSVILIIIFLIQHAGSKYNIEALNYNVPIKVTNDKDYGRGHTDDPVHYEMKIPTSGMHSPHDLQFGFYTEKPPYEKLVHNLEHGDIIIYYHPDADTSEIQKLKDLVQYKKAGSGILAVPNNDVPIDKSVTVTAWTKTMELASFDEQQIGTFIYQFINKGPEVIPPEIRQNGGTM